MVEEDWNITSALRIQFGQEKGSWTTVHSPQHQKILNPVLDEEAYMILVSPVGAREDYISLSISRLINLLWERQTPLNYHLVERRVAFWSHLHTQNCWIFQKRSYLLFFICFVRGAPTPSLIDMDSSSDDNSTKWVPRHFMFIIQQLHTFKDFPA